MTMLSTVGGVRWFCYNFVLLDNSWPQRWGAEWRQADLTSDPGNWPAPDIWALGDQEDTVRIMVTTSCILQCPTIALLTVTDADCWPWHDDYWPHDTDLGEVLVYSLSECDQPGRRTLSDCVLSLSCQLSPVTSLGSAQSPGQVRGKPQPIRELESSNNSREQERDIVFIKLSILSALHAYHISNNNPIHAEKSVCAKFLCQ